MQWRRQPRPHQVMSGNQKDTHSTIVCLQLPFRKMVPGWSLSLNMLHLTLAYPHTYASHNNRSPGKRSLAMEAFARALRALPTTICDNAGLDSADIVATLRAVRWRSRVRWCVFTQLYDVCILHTHVNCVLQDIVQRLNASICRALHHE